MVPGRTARRSHSRKKAQLTEPRRSRPKASGCTERGPPRWRKWRDARWGGSSWTVSQPRAWDWWARAAMKAWTAAVWSMFLRTCRLLLPETLRQSVAELAFRGETLHRFLAAPTEVRSRRASRASPSSVRASRPPAPGGLAIRPWHSRATVTWDVRGYDTFSIAASSVMGGVKVDHGACPINQGRFRISSKRAI